MKRRVWLRACPRCAGDLIRTTDAYDLRGAYRSCLQCGHTVEPKQRKAVAA